MTFIPPSGDLFVGFYAIYAFIAGFFDRRYRVKEIADIGIGLQASQPDNVMGFLNSFISLISIILQLLSNS